MRHPPSMAKLRSWRMYMKYQLLTERGRVCERCSESCDPQKSTDMDEGIVTRGDMMGMSNKQKLLAFSECNLFLLCANCNRNEAHQREWAFKRSCRRYGETIVRDWYRSLNLKAPRKDFL